MIKISFTGLSAFTLRNLIRRRFLLGALVALELVALAPPPSRFVAMLTCGVLDLLLMAWLEGKGKTWLAD